MPIRSFIADDLTWTHALNEEHAVELSSMTRDGFAELIKKATYVRIADKEAGLLITYDQGGEYSSVNFKWFCAGYDNFLYVDRIVISKAARGQGIAGKLYDDLFNFAKAKGYERIVCEVNSDPPNPASDAFHASLGFQIVGEAKLEGKGKTVRYMEKAL
ncbi:Acetyltransferase (GNAT) family protein [Pseudovibrio sp. Ad13]|uniref:GNAT family N-acetyltransferase n=1 Tax=unclassified Pseudovibrio TaxID=2627060 RepID=UPI0007AEA117|nr:MULTISPECIES: GNAT family N-acetyltransferase [unclassified Pseudovibrio]KZK87341.1 Acetyltransferase (GNAT) family protein [Pseudovibrio sp. Ad13]KZK89014.1 Acetyltransferase (GNAT) family protein [Pseudovibrio sp. Ad5]